MKKTATALALVLLLLIGSHPLSASDPAPPSQVRKTSPTLLVTGQGSITVENSCPAEEAAILQLPSGYGWRQASLAYAGPHTGMTILGPSDDQPAPFAVGAWFMGVGLAVFIITRKRFRN